MIKSQKNKNYGCVRYILSIHYILSNENNYVLGVSNHIYCPNNTVVLQGLQGKNPRHFEWIKP